MVGAVALAAAPFQALSGDQSVAAIHKEVAAIDARLAKLQRVESDLEGFSAEGGTARWASDASGVRRISAKVFGETRRASYLFYFANGALRFAYEKLELYETDLTSEVVRVVETRLYRADGRVVRLQVGNRRVSSISEDGVMIVSELINTANELKDAKP